MVSEELLDEFIMLFKKHYGVDLPRDEAAQKAEKLMNLYKVVYCDKQW